MDDGPFQYCHFDGATRREIPPVTELRFLALTLAPSGVDRWFVRNDKQSKLNYKH